MNKVIMIAVVTAIAAAGAGFFGGMKYTQSKNPGGSFFANGGFGNMTQEQRQQFMQQRDGRRQGGQGGFASGEIIAKDDKSITIKLSDGGSKIVLLSDSTQIGQFASGTTSDLALGKTVTISGTANQDGSVTAQMIQIRPQGQFTPDAHNPQTGSGDQPQAAPAQN